MGGTVEPNWIAKRPAWFPDEFAWVVGCSYKGLPESVEPVRNMLGCNMSFRREVFESLGGFRATLGRLGGKPLISCEETEFCIRTQRRFPQSRIIHEPRARVNHKVPSQRATWHYYRIRCYAEGLSKALVANYVGAADGLASEWKYTLRVLPLGFLRGIKNSILKGNPTGVLQAYAIASGLVITSLGYLIGRIKTHPNHPAASTFEVSERGVLPE